MWLQEQLQSRAGVRWVPETSEPPAPPALPKCWGWLGEAAFPHLRARPAAGCHQRAPIMPSPLPRGHWHCTHAAQTHHSQPRTSPHSGLCDQAAHPEPLQGTGPTSVWKRELGAVPCRSSAAQHQSWAANEIQVSPGREGNRNVGQDKVSPSWFCAGAAPLNISSASLLHKMFHILLIIKKLGLVLRSITFLSALIPALCIAQGTPKTGWGTEPPVGIK